MALYFLTGEILKDQLQPHSMALPSKIKIFLDVVIDGQEIEENGRIGISCKMRNTLWSFKKSKSISMELSNALNKFWSELQRHKIHNIGYARLVPERAGKIIVDLYESWKYQVAGNIEVNIEKSFYLTCLYDDRKGLYQLFALPFLLPRAESLEWIIRESKDKDDNKGTLVAKKDNKVIIEWYGTSGGQLKYYPTEEDVLWKSREFALEPIPNIESGYGLIQKAKIYFPDKWKF